eukprot:CAMPEP_0119305488 /NCGR_PEP_ID=MMETSP1333-20130426/6485_1 /TAXON_ID=418940 /ORGANISM="Scyphosphaera apsteinii, Strain RCC1455" /LENGTH=255 /DNA_ID=CAMNT_0007308591 /DNA_START=100 /DNA_END=867 /DNA_ORIENTATION=+
MLGGAAASFLAALRPQFPAWKGACQLRRTATAATATEAPPSFVQELRVAAMKLHSRDQSPQGEQATQTPVSKWEPERADYVQFLVDSQAVYGCLENLVAETDVLAPFRNSGLERYAALELDIAWFQDQGVPKPAVGTPGIAYVTRLREMAANGQWQAFICHFYNFYFAHIAGGRRIGRLIADKLLEGHTLQFYQWSAGDVDTELKPRLESKIDSMGMRWTREERDACIEETDTSFKCSGRLLDHIKIVRQPTGRG